MSRRKILCLIGQLGNGGTERQLFLFLKHLDRSRYEPQVLVSGEAFGRWAGPIASLGVQISELGNMGIIRKFLKFRKIKSEFNPDLIFSWSFFTNAFCLACPGFPFIGSLRGDLHSAEKNIGRPMSSFCLTPKHFIVNSSLLSEELRNAGVNDNHISFVGNMFDTETIPQDNNDRERIRSKYAIPKNAKVVIGAGRNTPEKNLGLFLRVFEELKRSDPTIYGFIIGDCAKSLQARVSEMKLSASLFLPGEVVNPFEFLRASDIFFLSSKTEGMPNIVIEASHCACGIVSMNVGGIKDIISASEHYDITIFEQNQNEKIIADGILRQLNTVRSDKNKFTLDAFSPKAVMPDYLKIIDKY